jgi:hypothetical protein
MTPQEVIDQARVLINDDNALMPERFSDTTMLGFVNQAVKRSVPMRPDLFIVNASVTPTADQVAQELDSTVTRIMEIHRVTGGSAVGEVDKETMDRSAPDWMLEDSDVPVNWMRHPRNPRRYFLYPPPITGTQLEAEYVKVPDDYLIGDTIGMPDSYKSALVDCVVFLAEVIDNESVETQRAKDFYNSFAQALGSDFTQRQVVDREDGMPQEEQRRRGQ